MNWVASSDNSAPTIDFNSVFSYLQLILGTVTWLWEWLENINFVKLAAQPLCSQPWHEPLQKMVSWPLCTKQWHMEQWHTLVLGCRFYLDAELHKSMFPAFLPYHAHKDVRATMCDLCDLSSEDLWCSTEGIYGFLLRLPLQNQTSSTTCVTAPCQGPLPEIRGHFKFTFAKNG